MAVNVQKAYETREVHSPRPSTMLRAEAGKPAPQRLHF